MSTSKRSEGWASFLLMGYMETEARHGRWGRASTTPKIGGDKPKLLSPSKYQM